MKVFYPSPIWDDCPIVFLKLPHSFIVVSFCQERIFSLLSPFAKEGFFPHLALEIFDRGFGSGEKYDKRVGAINSNALRTISSGIVFFHYCEKRQWNCGWISDILECCFCWWKMLYWGALSIERRHSDDGANEEHVRGGQVLNWGEFQKHSVLQQQTTEYPKIVPWHFILKSIKSFKCCVQRSRLVSVAKHAKVSGFVSDSWPAEQIQMQKEILKRNFHLVQRWICTGTHKFGCLKYPWSRSKIIPPSHMVGFRQERLKLIPTILFWYLSQVSFLQHSLFCKK